MATNRPYAVRIAAQAAKDVRRLPNQARSAVITALDALAAEPRSGKPLGGDLANIWSLRRGDYRILYRIDDVSKLVEVARIGHRRDVYRRAPGKR